MATVSKRDKDAHTDTLVNATCTFQVCDVLTLFDVTEDEAEEFLSNNRKIIQGRMCELGWEVMEHRGEMDGLKRKDDSERRQALDQLTAEAQELGLGY